MSGTLEAPTTAEQPTADQALLPPVETWTLRLFMRRHPWVSTAIGLVVVSFALLVWARTRPSYDAYGWLVWGYQAVHGGLNLGGAPSWKPLPFLFTAPYALAGHYEQWLWMVTSVTISLAGAIFAGRVAYRVIAEGDPERRRAALVGAVFAGAALLGIEDYWHYMLSAQSDPMIVTFCLAAIDFHLQGRRRWAFWMLMLAGLGRPEAWPFLGLYGLWLFWKFPSMRVMVLAGLVLLLFMWFGIPWITNNRPLVSEQLALRSPRSLPPSKRITGTINRFTVLHYPAVWVAAVLAAALALVRRNRLVIALTAGAVLWVLVEIAFALHGWPGLSRYMFEPAGVVAVLGGVAIGWLLLDVPRLVRGVPRWAGVVVAAAIVIVLVPGAIARMRAEHKDIHEQRGRTEEISLLKTTIDSVGGLGHVRACGEPVTIVEYASVLAYMTDLNVGSVGYLPSREMRQRYPIVLFASLPQGGWALEPWHTRPSQRASCSNLYATYAISPQEPGGFLVRTAPPAAG